MHSKNPVLLFLQTQSPCLHAVILRIGVSENGVPLQEG